MILPLARNKHPVWKQKFRNIKKISPEIKKLANDMKETLGLAGGVGLAAPQVGSPYRLFVVNFGNLNEVFVNPKILSRGKKLEEAEEGCLSVPRTWGLVKRPIQSSIEYLDLKGRKRQANLSGYYSRIIQHEYDHLSSVFFPDRIKAKSKIYTYPKIRVVFFGTPTISLPTLQSLIGKQFVGEYNLPLVVTTPDKRSGRGRKMISTPTHQLAKNFEIQVLKPEKVKNNPEFVGQLKMANPDFLVLISYGKILPKEVLTIPKKAALNIHFSLLPKYRGASPIQSAILKGDKSTGVTIFKMNEKVDEGEIITTARVKIKPGDTSQSIAEKLSFLGADLVNYAIHTLTINKAKMKKQNSQKASYTKLISKEDGHINLKKPPTKVKLERMIRAYYPWPGVWTIYNERVLKVLPERKVQLDGKQPITLVNFKKGHKDFTLSW